MGGRAAGLGQSAFKENGIGLSYHPLTDLALGRISFCDRRPDHHAGGGSGVRAAACSVKCGEETAMELLDIDVPQKALIDLVLALRKAKGKVVVGKAGWGKT